MVGGRIGCTMDGSDDWQAEGLCGRMERDGKIFEIMLAYIDNDEFCRVYGFARDANHDNTKLP